jgi:hypothetical protein
MACLLRVLVLLLSASLTAQTVHTVGPGGFAQIRDAIAAASPNDVIQVHAGIYQAFTLDKPLVITALPSPPGQIVQVINPSFFTPDVTVFRPPVGTRAYVTNLHFRNIWHSFWRMDTRVERGTVCFEECTFEGHSASSEPALRVQNAEVQLRHCLIQAAVGDYSGNAGLIVTNGAAFLADCFVRGGSLSIKANFAGGTGITCTDSQLQLTATNVVAGDSSSIACYSGYPGGHGVLVQGNSSVWIADCTITGGTGFCAAAGDALHNSSTVPVQLARATMIAGTGTPSGQGIFGPVQQESLLGLTGGTVGLARGQTWSVHYRTEPSWPVAVLVALDVLVTSSPYVHERLLVPLPGALVFALLQADALGDVRLQVPVPAVPSLVHQHVYLQAFSGFALPVRTQPALGGVIR